VEEEPPKPVIMEAPPKPVVVPAPIPKSIPTPVSAPAPAPMVVPPISTNVETIIPDGYYGAVPRIAADESLIWVKKISTKDDYYDSEDEDELDEFGYRKDRDVSRYIVPHYKTTVHGGRDTVAARGVDNNQVEYTLADRSSAGFANSPQPQDRTMAHGEYNIQPRQSPH
ncbi:hypothetical protein BGZ96_009027, partial [Linnemannia gamsii]